MIRFIFDSFGDSHNDIFIKFDVGISGNKLQVADFYFIPDFLNFESNIENTVEWKEKCFETFLEHLIGLINQNLDKTYLIFGLFDQGVSAIKLEKFIKNKVLWYKTSIVHSHKNYGWSMSHKIEQDEFIHFDWNEIDKNYWEITKDGIIKGLQWSIEYLRCKKPTIEWEI